MKEFVEREFRIYLGKKYFQVYIFKTTMQMRKYGWAIDEKYFHVKDRGRFFARFYGWNAMPRDKRYRDELGQIIFTKTHIGSGIVSHEFTHAALHYMVVKKWDLPVAIEVMDYVNAPKPEEKLCHHVGELNRCFWNAFNGNKRKVTVKG